MSHPWSDLQIGTRAAFALIDESGLVDATLQLARQARSRVRIWSRDLEPRIYDSADFLEAAQQLAVRSPRSDFRVLLRDADTLVRRGHRLMALARRLTSRVHIRVPMTGAEVAEDAFIVVDSHAFVRRPDAARPEGSVHFHAPREALALENRFEALWRDAQLPPDLRRLSL